MYLSVVSLLAIGYGIFMGIRMLVAPQKLSKLEEMKKRFGGTKAKLIYFFSYTVLPVSFGIIMIYRIYQFVPKK